MDSRVPDRTPISAFQDTSTVHEEQWHKHTVLCISLSELVSCAFSTIPICPFFNSKNFSFTCVYNIYIYRKFSPVVRLDGLAPTRPIKRSRCCKIMISTQVVEGLT